MTYPYDTFDTDTELGKNCRYAEYGKLHSPAAVLIFSGTCAGFLIDASRPHP